MLVVSAIKGFVFAVFQRFTRHDFIVTIILIVIGVMLGTSPLIVTKMSNNQTYNFEVALLNYPGENLELFYNLKSPPVVRQTVNEKYLDFGRNPIQSLPIRLDLGSSSGKLFRIAYIEIKTGTGIVLRLNSDTISTRIRLSDCEFFARSNSSIDILTTGNDAQIFIEIPELRDKVQPGIIQSFNNLYTDVNANYIFVFGLLSIIVLILLVFITGVSAITYGVLVTATSTIFAFWVSGFLTLPSTTLAIGWNTYTGLSYHASIFAAFLPLILLILFFILKGRKNAAMCFNVNSFQGEIPRKRTLVDVIYCFLLFLLSIDRPSSLLQGALNPELISNWDSNNLEVWKILVAQGKLPIRDFDYPYENLYLLDPSVPLGNLLNALLVCISVFLLFRSFPKHHSYHVAKIFIILVVIAFPSGLVRYLFPFVLTIFFWTSRRNLRKTIGLYTLFALSCYLSWQTFGYVLVSLFSALLITIPRLYDEKLRRKVFTSIILVSTSAIPSILISHFQGSLTSRVASNLKASAALQFGTNSGLLSDKISLNPSFLIFTVLLLFLGFLSHKKLITQSVSAYPAFCSGIFLLCMFQKDFVRNSLSWILPLIVIWILLLLLFLLNQFESSAKLHFWFVPISIAILTSQYFATSHFSSRISYHHLSESVRGLTEFPRIVKIQKDLNATLISSTSIAAKWPKEAPVLSELERLTGNSYAVLGDAPMLYLGHPVNLPHNTDMWLMSPLSNQLQFIKENASTRYLVVSKSSVKFDGIQFQVRLPRVYNWAHKNFDYSKGIDLGEYRVIPRALFTKDFGWPLIETDYGEIFSSIQRKPRPCQESESESCSTIVSFLATSGRHTISILSSLDNKVHKVSFSVRESQEISIDLNKFYFSGDSVELSDIQSFDSGLRLLNSSLLHNPSIY
jgi:hypothetical protein